MKGTEQWQFQILHCCNIAYIHMNKGGKFLKKLWCCVGGRV